MALSFTAGTTPPAVPSVDDVAAYPRYALDKYRYQGNLEPMTVLLSTLSKDHPEQIIEVLKYFNQVHAYPLVIAAVPYLDHVEKVDDLGSLVDILVTLVRDAHLTVIRKVLQRCVKWECNFNKGGVKYHTGVMIALIGRPFTSEKDKLELLQAFIEAGFSPRFFFVKALHNEIRFAEYILVHKNFTQTDKNALLQHLLLHGYASTLDHSALPMLLSTGATLNPMVQLNQEQQTRYTAALAQAKNITVKLSFTPDPTIRDVAPPSQDDVDASKVYVLNMFIHDNDRQPMKTLLNNIAPDRIVGVLEFFREQYAYPLLIDGVGFLRRVQKIEEDPWVFERILTTLLRYAPKDRMNEVLEYPCVRMWWIYWKDDHEFDLSLLVAITNQPFMSEQDKLNRLQALIESGLPIGVFLCEHIVDIPDPHVVEFMVVHYHDKIDQDGKNHLLAQILYDRNANMMDPVVLPLLIFFGARYDPAVSLTEEQINRYRTAHALVVTQVHEALQSKTHGPSAWKVVNDPHLLPYILKGVLYTPDWEKLRR